MILDTIDKFSQMEALPDFAGIIGEGELEVNSSHHQAIADPGSLVVTGYAEDGVIEACEDPTRTFCLGVQWHPESPDQETGPKLFGALVRAAAAYRERRDRR